MAVAQMEEQTGYKPVQDVSSTLTSYIDTSHYHMSQEVNMISACEVLERSGNTTFCYE